MPVTIGVPVQQLVTSTTISLLAQAALGGTAPYTYQWYRSSNPSNVFDPSNILSGQNSLALLDTPVSPNTVFYYLIRATDNVGATANSPVLGVCSASQDQLTYLNPSVADFKNFYFRDFPYGTDLNTTVTDADILKAFQQVNTQINTLLYLSQASFTQGYLWLSAHRLCVNINNSSQGLNGQFNWGETSKSVGGVSQSFTIPDQILKNPYLYSLTKTTYGADYVMDLLPRMVGVMGSVFGNTKP